MHVNFQRTELTRQMISSSITATAARFYGAGEDENPHKKLAICFCWNGISKVNLDFKPDKN